MKIFTWSDRYEKGTWKEATDSEGKKRFAVIVCPDCGTHYSLGFGVHKIGDDGTVSPSVVCTQTPCHFHEFIKLDGWDNERSRCAK